MLTNRLQMVLSLIDKDDIIADIGTDHGYLLMYAFNKGVKLAQGIENKQGPYTRACLNLNEQIKKGICTITLSSGLNDVLHMVDTIVMAGMGGELIVDILTENLDVAKRMKKIILCPNKKNYELRKFLSENGFLIEKELITQEANFFYEAFLVKPVNNIVKLTDIECEFGPYLLKYKNDVFKAKWCFRLNQYMNIIHNSDCVIPDIEKKVQQIKEVLND